MIEDIFIKLSLVILIAVAVSFIVRLLKQPLIIGYILTGILVSPYVFSIIKSQGEFVAFSHLGISLLLFIVGLNLNPKIIKEVGKVSILTALGQFFLTSSLALAIGLLFGFSLTTSLYIAVALSFSSTIIIMKLLADKGDIDTLYGRISIGFLIIQDLIAILILIFLSSASGELGFSSIVVRILLGVGSIVALFFFGIYLMPAITKFVARSQEFLLLFSIGWCLALAAIFNYLRFSTEIGALLAGITLSVSPYRYEIGSKIKPLRDFFLVIFFVLLGSQMIFTDISKYIIPIIVFSVLVLVGNPIIVFLIITLMGYTKRNSFLSGMTVAQISEFSLIVLALGVTRKDITPEILSLVTMVGLITIAGSTYFIMYSSKIYPLLSKYLRIFEKKGKKIDEHKYHSSKNYHVILFGHNRIGYDLIHSIKKLGKKFLVVDYNPEIIVALAKQKIEARYGDADDSELLDELNLSKARMVISTIPDLETNLLLIKKVKERNQNAILIVVSHHIDDSLKLYEEGATYVVMPHFLGGRHTATLIERYKFGADKFLKERIAHIEHLKMRKEEGHEHPKHL